MLAVFAISRTYAEHTAVLAAHQGLSNGFLAAGLLYGVLRRNDACKFFFLSWAVAAGTLGGLTIGPAPFIIEAVPALVALAGLGLAHSFRMRHAIAA